MTAAKIIFDTRELGQGVVISLVGPTRRLQIGVALNYAESGLFYQFDTLTPEQARELRDVLAQTYLPTLAELGAGPLPGARARSSQLDILQDIPLQTFLEADRTPRPGEPWPPADPLPAETLRAGEVLRGPLDVAADEHGAAWENPFDAPAPGEE